MEDELADFLEELKQRRPPLKVQTLIFAKTDGWTRAKSVTWAKDHDFKADKVDETDESFRLRQFDPGRCTEGTARTFTIPGSKPPVKAVGCRTKSARDLTEIETKFTDPHSSEIKSDSIDRDKREFDAVASTNKVDREGEIVEPAAFAETLEDFKDNPVMLFSHNPFKPPIGLWLDIRIQKSKIPVRGRMRPEGDDELADNLWRAVETRFLTKLSIGFHRKITEPAEFEPGGALKKPQRLVKADLLEISLVNVPANVDAGIRMMKILATDAFENEELVREVFAPAPTDAQVIKRASKILRRYGDDEIEGRAQSDELIAAIKELREHIVGLAADRKTDFGRLRAVRELAADFKKLRGA